MKRYWIACVVAMAGCTNPVAPEQVNIHQYTCITQPRVYCNSLGEKCAPEIDHYTQTQPCPVNPIP